ncbi:MAG TPA: cell division protein FtsZ [Sphingobium sp.]|uniref:cell division protein FtsZ n=1 Tax=unclassified Sphingobium TaxID=2611147 RepID=UPI0007F4704B|nr:MULTISPECIES: cell division protein FtsZ [unclassified Sphingobium]OAN57875.1 cell division protein FtsZ [Sphingobium sp. TCM1]WIW87460.1 cell division protein FtsZ [Sphingobium sp. V4]HAF42042.1 cell division protein FtsZ [Sphingobium sp.]
MSIEISPPHVDELKPRIAVIGVGGAGGNAIANMIAASVEGVDFIVANTDAQALNSSPAERRIQLGPQITEGLGAGSRPEIGKAAAEETIASVEQALDGAHMCFITAGMGGGTGTGAAPVIAKAARERGILTVGVVTKPFTFEGNRRMKSAESGIEELQKHVDTLIVIPNQNLFLIANPNTTFKEAFQMADEVLQQGVRSITDLMIMPGLINLDFADVRSVMGEMGKAMMGTGEAEGDGRALQAAEKAIANPLLDGVSMRGAKGVIVSIVGGDDMRLMEVDEAANHIRELVDPDANIIWGSAFNDNLNGKIRVSVVATGIDSDVGAQAAPLTQPFSFASRPTVAVPQPASRPAAVAPAPQPIPAPAPEPETLELDVPEAPAPAPVEKPVVAAPARPAAVFSDEGPDQDELVLGADNAEQPAPAPAAPAQPAPRVATGGTLFERMAGLTRGSEKAPSSDESAPGVDIPRFLNRQSNQ